MQINMEDSTDLQRLSQLCLPCWDNRIKTLALRPERPEYAIFTAQPQDNKWVQVLKYLERDICYRLQRFTTLYQKPSVGLYLDTLGYLHTLTPNLRSSLQAIAAILYDQECSGYIRDLEMPRIEKASEREPITLFRQFYPSPDKMFCFGTRLLKPLFEHMLLVDYGIHQADMSGIGRAYIWAKEHQEFNDFCRALVDCAQSCKQASSTLCQFDTLAKRLIDLNSYSLYSQFDFSDLAIMLHYYDTHRRPLEPTSYNKGATGYFGVLQELISEVPLRGTNRLQRKLSVDVNELIPRVVKDPWQRKRMIYIAEDIAAQYNLCLYRPAQGISKPIFEKKYRDGFLIPKTNWAKRVKNTCKVWAVKTRDSMKRTIERERDDKEPLFAQKDLRLYKLHARYISS
jgi:hypothetical protein